MPMPRELDARIRQLIAAGVYAPAIAELDFARRQWGTTPALDATLAWLYNAQGDLRRGINAMKRAYPQYLADDGHRLPNHVQKVLFPVDYWPLIKRHSAARGLDPYLIAALVAQESTFDAGVRSSANAWGLMQVLPSTGRQLARSLKIRRFTTASLTNPEINVRLGTLYFQRLVKQFGGAHYALASYNAGENRVERWINERPPLPQDEFIDDIPYPRDAELREAHPRHRRRLPSPVRQLTANRVDRTDSLTQLDSDGLSPNKTGRRTRVSRVYCTCLTFVLMWPRTDSWPSRLSLFGSTRTTSRIWRGSTCRARRI